MKRVKTLLAIVVAMVMVLAMSLALAGCNFTTDSGNGGGSQIVTPDNPDSGNNGDETPDNPDSGNNGGDETPDNPDSGNNGGDETPDKPDIGNNGGDDSGTTQQPSHTVTPQTPVERGDEILVVYFSATNNTKTIAGYIGEYFNSDIYEIVPKQPYSADDINYNLPTCRAVEEQHNENARPEIGSDKIENFDEYGTIFVGYPIWGGIAPRIMQTFFESYNFYGATIIPFCSSGGSPLSTSNIKGYASQSDWKEGKQFSGAASESLVTSWLVTLGIAVTPETPTEPDTPIEQESKALVVYFSATNNTEKVARYIQAYLNCDLYEITAAVPYTAADLNYNTDCRANREQNDPTARPAIGSAKIENIEQYDTIFLGYPIWWGQAPKIIYTFLESYEFSDNVTIIPFCTSASSGIGSSANNLHTLAPNAKWETGIRFSGSASHSTVTAWVDTFQLKKED